MKWTSKNILIQCSLNQMIIIHMILDINLFYTNYQLRQALSGYVYIIIIIIIIIINFYYCHYNWYHYCIYYDMFIDTITFTKYISYVSEIAQVRYTLTWCLPFDSDGISSDLLYDWRSCLLCFIHIIAFLGQQCLVIHNHHDDAEQPALIK